MVCAWGNHGLDRSRQVRELLRGEYELHILKLTGAGEPGHPLYLEEIPQSGTLVRDARRPREP